MMMLIQVIKDYQLMAVVCILVLVDVLVLTVWEFVDPLVIEVSNKTLEVLVSFSRSFLPAKCYHFFLVNTPNYIVTYLLTYLRTLIGQPLLLTWDFCTTFYCLYLYYLYVYMYVYVL